MPKAPRGTAWIEQLKWEHRQLEIRCDQPVVLDRHVLHDPERVVLDVVGADLPPQGIPERLAIDSGAIRQVRIARHPRAGFVRVVVDLSAPAPLRVWQPSGERILARLARSVQSPGPTRSSREHAPASEIQAIAGGDDLEGAATRSIAWPANPQLVDRMRIDRDGGETEIRIQSAAPLMAWIEQDLLVPRIQIRLPRATVHCPAPRPTGLARRVSLQQQASEADLTIDLPKGLYVMRENWQDGDRLLDLRIRRRPRLRPRRLVVVVDPGHGGVDPGTAGPRGDTESAVVLAVAHKVARALDRDGFEPVLTRTVDAFVRLSDRAAFIAATHAAAFVSLHCNSSGQPDVAGVETYFRQPPSERLAEAIQHSVVAATEQPDRGARQAHLLVLKGSEVPATLLEMGFLTNPAEESQLVDPRYQTRLARAISRGIQDYLDRMASDSMRQECERGPGCAAQRPRRGSVILQRALSQREGRGHR
ncbi:MAG: N-acetylmuramoyl-L-alanine amidase, partial [Cyanobacteria bacterium REEB65]|nr:N-acetylmuramoyl-L-alanine amidase [Cyanobacteria bacterium REEB65]